ncbi:hypothetical protein CBS101457_005841 [Exobasidium rhododendri]|nr:hypothetical protein CBS101457_005841 [Exobasidium rhododendri]
MAGPNETRSFLNSPTSSDETTAPDRRGQLSPKSQPHTAFALATGSNAILCGPGIVQGDGLQHLRREQTPSVRSNASTITSNWTWQRPVSGRYDLSRKVGSDCSSSSPVAAQISPPTCNEHDPGRWHTDKEEPDDYLHDVSKPDQNQYLSARGMMNLGTLVLLALSIAMLFMGYPILSEFYFDKEGYKDGFGLGGSNASGQIPDVERMGFRASLIDKDTPRSSYKKMGLGLNNDETWNLQWSDEFDVPGRSFYPGDDPFWEAVNLYAHGTADYEWYDPAAVTTRNGSLVITCTEQDNQNHNLRFRSGQVTTWNQLCYTGGYLETSVVLPGSPRISGWWPAIWTMGNLGRANYGATTQGMWPYSYEACDRGTLANQTDADGLGPVSALQSGGETMFNDKYNTTSLSWQPGQRLSACTCPHEDHPGPIDSKGNYVGRSAPEIDLFEAQIDDKIGGSLSMSGQFMPANSGYWLNNATGNEIELNTVNGKKAEMNIYRGNILQQSASGIVVNKQDAYENAGDVYSVWGFEYEPGDDGYITWWVDGVKAWTMHASAVGPDAKAGISQRPIPKEPMYIIANLAISSGFGWVDWDKLVFPGKLKVDYLRLYQAKGKENIGCSPKDYPTKDYIERHKEAYTNANLTVWGGTRSVGGYEQNWPRNKLNDGGDGCAVAPRKYPGPLRTGAAALADTNVAMQDSVDVNPSK